MPPRKPRHLKALQGTMRGDRESMGPKPQPLLGEPPRGLPVAARKLWRELGPRLEEQGLGTVLDRPAFERLCRLHAQLLEVEETINKEGWLLEDGRGSIKRHPAALIYQTLLREYRELLRTFGVGPRSRQGLDVYSRDAEQAEIDEFEKLFLQ